MGRPEGAASRRGGSGSLTFLSSGSGAPTFVPTTSLGGSYGISITVETRCEASPSSGFKTTASTRRATHCSACRERPAPEAVGWMMAPEGRTRALTETRIVVGVARVRSTRHSLGTPTAALSSAARSRTGAAAPFPTCSPAGSSSGDRRSSLASPDTMVEELDSPGGSTTDAGRSSELPEDSGSDG